MGDQVDEVEGEKLTREEMIEGDFVKVNNPESTAEEKTKEDKTEQEKNKEDKTEEEKTEEDKREEEKSEEEKTGENYVWVEKPDPTAQEKTAEEKTEEDKTEEEKKEEWKTEEEKTEEEKPEKVNNPEPTAEAKTKEEKTEEDKTEEEKKEEEKTEEEKTEEEKPEKVNNPEPTAEADKPSLKQRFLACICKNKLGEPIRQKLRRDTFTEEDLMAIPRPDENIQKTFVGVLSSETAEKLKAMFRRDFCPEIVPLIRGPELKPECRLVICCLPKNTRQMYLDSSKFFTKLIEDAGILEAMVLIIIFGEKKAPQKTLHDESIYGNVLQQGWELYMKGRRQTSQLDNPCQDNPNATENRDESHDGLSKNIALVTVNSHPSSQQLVRMKNFVESAFNDTRVSDESVDCQH